MSYSEIISVEEKFSTLIVRGTETRIKMKGICYAQSRITKLLKELGHVTS